MHRRLLLLRAAESAGLGLVIGCAAALPLILILMCRGEPAMRVPLVLLPLSAGAGLIWFGLRRPRLIEAAIAADRQLNTADLLSTAWVLWQQRSALPSSLNADDAFPAAVLATAEARCAALAPSSVLLGRLGMRAWGGIGVATALVFAVGLISASPVGSHASDHRLSLLKPATTPAMQHTLSNRGMSASKRHSSPVVADHPGGKDEPIGPVANTTATSAKATGNSDITRSAADPTGRGGGSGRSNSSTPNDLRIASGTNADRSGEGDPSGGSGSASVDASNTRQGSSGVSVGSTPFVRPTPAWSSPSWPQAREAADAAVRSGHIPPRYHDLVREYFGI